MNRPYSQKTSIAVVGIVGCIALWVIVIAFTNMNDEVNQLSRDVTELKTQVSHPANSAPAVSMPPVPTPPAIPVNLAEPKTPPPTGLYR